MQSETSPATSEFEQELAEHLKALRLPQAAAQKAEALCKQHDFSSARVHLIISRPGYHSGDFALACLVRKQTRKRLLPKAVAAKPGR